MNINTNRDELSKLKEHEFYLDLDELERLHKETDAEIQRVCLIFVKCLIKSYNSFQNKKKFQD